MAVLRIVADTNLWVAARFNPNSYSAKILDMAGEGRLEILWSKETRRELEKIMGNVKAPPSFMAAIEHLLSAATDVGTIERLDIIKEDPDDNKFLACAKAGNANYIVTSDIHLLSLGRFGDVEIVTPKAFLQGISRKHVM